LFGRRDAPLYFFLRRCARIVPLYWAVSTLLLAYVLLQLSDLRSANLSIESVVASILFFPYPKLDGEISPINGIGWTLNYEMFFYVVFAVALLVSRRAAVIGISVLFLGLVAASRLFGPFANPFAFWSDPIIIEFVFGMWIALAFRAGLRVPGWMSCGLVMAGVAVIVGSFFWGFGRFPRLLEWGVPAALVVGCIVMLRERQSTAIGWRMLGFLGDASYALYLIHPMALTLPRLIIHDLALPATHPWLYVVLLYLIVVAAAIAIHLLFEKPMTRLLQ
jgi:peptidoglycan/LPS O-acetylase OafA/YrhL